MQERIDYQLEDLEEVFSEHGPFAERLSNYHPRAVQQQLAAAVADTLADRTILIAEAGTGTGKTFAYLVPALLSEQKVIISTGTRTLQDQLYHRDLPQVQQALGVGRKTALLKGRANYLCLYRMDQTLAQGRLRSRAQVHELQLIRAWAGQTRSGDIAELNDVPEDSGIWPRVTSSADNCLGQDCPHYRDCYVVQARKQAQDADLVVINHHLFFADLALKEEGFAELLPGAEAIILDEAHQLPEIAPGFFSLSCSARQLNLLVDDSQTEALREAADQLGLDPYIKGLAKAVADFRLQFDNTPQRSAWLPLAEQAAVRRALEDLHEVLNDLAEALSHCAQCSPGLEACWQRARALADLLQLFREPPVGRVVQWLETYQRGFALHQTPLDIRERLNEQFAAERAWVFTSATLAVDGKFDHFAKRMGVRTARTECLPSDFDYATNALMYVPKGLPQPNESDYTQAVVQAALPVVEAAKGRSFLLFTSHRALQQAAELLRDRLAYPVLVQGQMPRAALLAEFRRLGNAVLLGTSSFWEGVDVRGEALSCVIIDKLPFASPGDPVTQARLEIMRENGQNPFRELQLPQAVIALKQGVGRLIRDNQDRGVLMLCDPRLFTKSYGRVFLNSLPNMPVCRDVKDVETFFCALSTQPQLAEGGVP